MVNQIIKLSKSSISKGEIISVNKVLKKGFFGMGDEVFKFEKRLSKYFGRDAVCVTNGFAALQLALQACGVKSGDEVIVPSLTYIATYQAVSAIGAIPVSCDVDIEDLMIDINFAKKLMSKKTKAIIPVFFGGHASRIQEIYKFAKLNNLRVIEDAAHAFGSYYKNNKIGAFGDITCFSFDGIKNITSGEGGCVVTKDTKIIKKIKILRTLGVENLIINKKRNWRFDSKVQGWRYHMSDIMAAIGLVQLSRLPELRKKRQSLAKNYDILFKNSLFVEIFTRNYNLINPHIYIIKIKDKKEISNLRIFLSKNKIETGLHYQPNHLLSKYKTRYSLPITDLVSESIITIPLHPNITKKDQIYICNKINMFFKNKK